MIRFRALVILLSILVTISAFARPERPQETIFYDGNGNEIGGIYIGCDGSHQTWGNTNSDSLKVFFGEPCPWMFAAPISCMDAGLVSLGSCGAGDSGNCYSYSYAMSFNNDFVPDDCNVCVDNQWGPCDACNRNDHPLFCPARPGPGNP